MKNFLHYFTTLPPGTIASGLLGIVQMIAYLAPFVVFDGYDFVAVLSGYESFFAFLIPPFWFLLVIPLSTIVALFGLIANSNKTIATVSRRAKFVICISALSLLFLIWLAEPKLEVWGIWCVLFAQVFICAGNIMDLKGIGWESLRKR